jgi:hypothetical protein
VEDAGGKELEHFVDDFLHELVDGFVGRVEAVIGEALHRLVFARFRRVAQVRQSLKRGIEMAGHVDFGDDGDGKAIGERHDLAGGVLGVIAAGWMRP